MVVLDGLPFGGRHRLEEWLTIRQLAEVWTGLSVSRPSTSTARRGAAGMPARFLADLFLVGLASSDCQEQQHRDYGFCLLHPRAPQASYCHV